MAAAEAPRWGIWDAVAAFVIGFLASNVAAGIALAASGVEEMEDLSLWVLALVQVPLWLGLAGYPWLVSRRKGSGSLAADFGLRMRPLDVPLGLVVGFASQLGLAAAAPAVYRALGFDPDRIGASAEELADRATDPVGVIALFLVVVVGAAVFEELCYRGLWLRSLEHRLGTGAAVVVSSVVFGLVHFEPYDIPLLVAFGLVLALLTVWTGRLGPAIWAHVAFNLTALVELLSS